MLHGLFSGWRFELDNPNFLGWSVVAVYFAGAWACAYAAQKAGGGNRKGDSGMWWILAAGLFFLGVNKQLNLQTLMIVLGRNLALAEGWSKDRRTVQIIFSAVFGLAAAGCLLWLAIRQRVFFARNSPVLAGVIVLVFFVALRAATINHTDEFLKVDLKDDSWAWLLEMAGSALIGIAAFRSRECQ